MSTHDPAAARPAAPGPREPLGDTTDPDVIEAHIAATRQDLAETIDALGAKLDVRTRASDRVHRALGVAPDGEPRPTKATQAVLAGAVAVAAFAAAVVVWRRDR
ncbi:DUF3618 domain-containing protein [Phycicoccus flavus]|uniref:DUF3618 domain-containing protein n=1 Tax=Phycicoccus flavus TaxID=2502783 RepID=UPI000FEBD55E|nr:DUF3618 domain-containing protein [Phycicoccus flavus]NHA68852.1 DUF3618 domain-containing protein [Phycicoccus flavus]